MVVRPPPLQLRDDNTRHGRKLQSRSSSNPSIYSRLYESSWRNLIIIVATINAIRYFCSVLVMAELWKELELDNASLRQRKLRSIILAIAIIYSLTGLIELFGGISAITRRLRLIRLYTHLAIISGLLVTAAGIVVAVTHFNFADEVIEHCMSQAIKSNGQNGPKLIFRSTPPSISGSQVRTPNSFAVESSCLDTWSSQSSTQILAIFLCYLLPSTIYYIVVYTYYRQCIDPGHAASLYNMSQNDRHPYERLVNMPPMTATTMSAMFLQFSARIGGGPVYGHYRNGMCARHRPDGSLIVKGKSQSKPKHDSQLLSPGRELSSGATSATTHSNSRSKMWLTSTSGPGYRAQLQRTRSDRSDNSMMTVSVSVSPGPPSYSGIVYDDRFKLEDHGSGYHDDEKSTEGEFVN